MIIQSEFICSIENKDKIDCAPYNNGNVAN